MFKTVITVTVYSASSLEDQGLPEVATKIERGECLAQVQFGECQPVSPDQITADLFGQPVAPAPGANALQ